MIAALALRNVEPIVAADFSPLRRKLATAMGAHAVVDPAERPAIDAYRELADLRPTVLFECVGVPGVLDQIMRQAPLGSRIVVAGVCMEDDTIRPMVGINKELNTPVRARLHSRRSSRTRSTRSRTAASTSRPSSRAGSASTGVAQAFRDLARPETHAKILVEPWR